LSISDIKKEFIADQDDIESLVHIKIDPDFFMVYPTGYRINIVLEEPVENIGRITLPENIQAAAANKMGMGFIFAVGPLAGQVVPGGMQGVLCEEPKDLLGLHVIIAAHAGTILTMGFNRDYPALVIMMDTRNVQAVDTNLIPMKYRDLEVWEPMKSSKK